MTDPTTKGASMAAENAAEASKDLEVARMGLLRSVEALSPIESPAELFQRIPRIVRELRQIEESLLLYRHTQQIESAGLEERLQEIDRQIADGVAPESSPVEDVVARLREHVETSH